MDSLIGYGSDDEVDSDRYGGQQQSAVGGGTGGTQRRRDDDTNYEAVNMDMSEDSQGESEPELPPAEPVVVSRHSSRDDRRGSDDSRSRSRSDRSERDDRDKRSHRRDSSPRARSRSERSDKLDRADRHDRPERSDRSDRLDRSDRPDRSDRLDRSNRPDRSDRLDRSNRHERSDKSDRSDDSRRSERSDRSRGYEGGSSRRGLLGDRPDDSKVPALMDLKPFGGEPPPGIDQRKSHDARDAVSPRFTDRDRRERERERERHSRRSEERRSSHRHGERRERSRSRGAAYPPPSVHTSTERRSPPTSSSDYRPSSYKVNKKLEVMEKMGLQIKTPDGSMATAQQLRAAASEAPPSGSGLPSYYNTGAGNTSKILDQVQKRKLLWSNKNKSEAEEAAKWSGTRFAQDSDGKQVSKFMRLMGIKEPAAVKPEPTDKNGDPIKKQEELFQAMQAQYEVARATTHTMRGVGLGFQRGQY